MPIIRVEMFAGKSVAQKRELVATFTREMARITGCKESSVYIVLDEVKKEDWGASGQLCSDLFPD